MNPFCVYDGNGGYDEVPGGPGCLPAYYADRYGGDPEDYRQQMEAPFEPEQPSSMERTGSKPVKISIEYPDGTRNVYYSEETSLEMRRPGGYQDDPSGIGLSRRWVPTGWRYITIEARSCNNTKERFQEACLRAALETNEDPEVTVARPHTEGGYIVPPPYRDRLLHWLRNREGGGEPPEEQKAEGGYFAVGEAGERLRRMAENANTNQTSEEGMNIQYIVEGLGAIGLYRHLVDFLSDKGFEWTNTDAAQQGSLYFGLKDGEKQVSALPLFAQPDGRVLKDWSQISDALEAIEAQVSRREWHVGCNTVQLQHSGALRIKGPEGAVLAHVSVSTLREIADASRRQRGADSYSELLQLVDRLVGIVEDNDQFVYTIRRKVKEALEEAGYL